MGCLELLVTATLAAAPVVKTIEVPAALLKVTRPPEPSGLAWSEGLGRYLVVSDDTGFANADNDHAPMVFGLSAAGKLDDAPIVIEGIDALNDAEGICAGPDGTFFLTTSHSLNKKGKVAKARRMLLQLQLKGRLLTVIGRADLTAGKGLLAQVDLPRDAPLDIEALAWREGALYLGLKSPLGSKGEAQVVRLDNALPAMKGAAPVISAFAQLNLCALEICAGVSDMVFLDDGSLIVTANTPKHQASDGGGAVFWARAPVGKAPVELLHRFPGLKPEGVTLAPGGDRLVVVFDGDLNTARWAELPRPVVK